MNRQCALDCGRDSPVLPFPSGGDGGQASLVHQLPEGWAGPPPRPPSLSSVLWVDVVEAEAEPLAPAGPELMPLEVLTELCWMASFWGLPGTDISSQLSSLSETGARGDSER